MKDWLYIKFDRVETIILIIMGILPLIFLNVLFLLIYSFFFFMVTLEHKDSGINFFQDWHDRIFIIIFWYALLLYLPDFLNSI